MSHVIVPSYHNPVSLIIIYQAFSSCNLLLVIQALDKEDTKVTLKENWTRGLGFVQSYSKHMIYFPVPSPVLLTHTDSSNSNSKPTSYLRLHKHLYHHITANTTLNIDSQLSKYVEEEEIWKCRLIDTYT